MVRLEPGALVIKVGLFLPAPPHPAKKHTANMAAANAAVRICFLMVANHPFGIGRTEVPALHPVYRIPLKNARENRSANIQFIRCEIGGNACMETGKMVYLAQFVL